MVQVNSNPVPDDDDNSTQCTAVTPVESVAADFPNDFPNDYARSSIFEHSSSFSSSSASVPWPGSTFIIRSASSRKVITLLDGQVVLVEPDGRGSVHWACVESKGWLGFRNVASGKFLGHGKNWNLHCLADRQQWWECFCVRARPEGGYVLLMTHASDTLWHVGITLENGVERLAKVQDGGSFGLVWEFLKV